MPRGHPGEVKALDKLLCPVMSVDDKYRTLYAALMGVFKEVAEFAQQADMPRDAVQGVVNAALHGAGVSAGIRLKRVYRLGDTVEDAVKMLVLFNNEAMAYLPKMKQIYGEIGKNEGMLIVKNDPWYDWYFKDLGIDCAQTCGSFEFPGLLSVLSPDLKVTVVRARPRGDDICSFRITKGKA